MLVHLVSRPLTPSDHIPASAIALLARSLESAGARVIEDFSALPASDITASVDACAGELADAWRELRPDIVHTIGIVATMAAVKEIQMKHGLPSDGFVGPLTKIALYNEQPGLEIPHLRKE